MTVDGSSAGIIIDKTIHLAESFANMNTTLLLHLKFDRIEDMITLSLAPSLSEFRIEPIPVDVQNFLGEHNELETINTILEIFDEGVLCEIDSLSSCFKEESDKLGLIGVKFEIDIQISKTSIINKLQEVWKSNGFNLQPIVFLSINEFLRFLKSDNYYIIFESFNNSRKSLLFAVGGLNTLYSGQFSILTDLWMSVEEIKDTVHYVGSMHPVLEKIEFLRQTMPKTLRSTPIFPCILDFDFSASLEEHKEIIRTIRNIQVFSSLLMLATDTIKSNERNEYDIRITGQKLIEGKVLYKEGILHLDDDINEYDTKEFIELYKWGFEDNKVTRVIILRKTIALHSSILSDILLEATRILHSSESTYQISLDKNIGQMIEIRQKFSEFAQEWTKEDIDLRIKLHEILYNAAYGGFGTLLGIVLAVINRDYQPFAASIVLLVVPILFLGFIVLGILRLKRIEDVFDEYLQQHLRHIKYYNTVLGKETIQAIAGKTEKEELEQEFKQRSRQNYLVLISLAVIAVVVLVVFIGLGYISYQSNNVLTPQ